ncbi:10797_t:CDS:2, partial [Ambispora leptoticha]
YPNHRSKIQRLVCNEPLAELINIRDGTLLRPLKIYPIGSIKQQLYMMYQQEGFEKMLRHSRPNEPSKHQINNYLAPIVDELIELSSGIKLPATFEYKEGRRIYVALILSANDVPAARKICGHASHAIKCHRCPKRAKYDCETKRNHYSGFENMDEWFKPIDISQNFKAANEWLSCKNKKERDDHVKRTRIRWSELYRLKYFDPVKFMVVDPMHCLFLGIGKWIMKQCLLNNNKLSRDQLIIIEKRISNVKVSSEIRRIPSKVARGSEGFNRFTADQWRVFYQVYAILFKQRDLDEAHTRLINMAKLIEEHYGQHMITSNIHLSLHIRQCCLDYGPLYAYWCYSFERMNGLLGTYPTSNRSIEPELMRILMKNAQVEFRINSVDMGEAKLLLDQALSLLDKKVRGSLKMTENFECEDLVDYLKMADKITNVNVITGTEKYLGEIIGMINENVYTPDEFYQNLINYYSTLSEELYGDLYVTEPIAIEQAIS